MQYLEISGLESLSHQDFHGNCQKRKEPSALPKAPIFILFLLSQFILPMPLLGFTAPVVNGEASDRIISSLLLKQFVLVGRCPCGIVQAVIASLHFRCYSVYSANLKTVEMVLPSYSHLVLCKFKFSGRSSNQTVSGKVDIPSPGL